MYIEKRLETIKDSLQQEWCKALKGDANIDETISKLVEILDNEFDMLIDYVLHGLTGIEFLFFEKKTLPQEDGNYPVTSIYLGF
jgi:enoyl-[acyl-carrier-protein] reductase (NADH)